MYCRIAHHVLLTVTRFTKVESNIKCDLYKQLRGNLYFVARQNSTRAVYLTNKMPKKEKMGKVTQKKQPEPQTSPVSTTKDGDISIAIHAKPGAKQNAVTDVSSEAVGVAIAAPPTDGEANAELVRYLSKVLELRRSEITLDKGSKSREKIIKVTAAISQEEVLKRLKQEAGSQTD